MKRFLIIFLVVTFSVVLFAGQIKNPDKPARGVWDLKMKEVWTIENAGEDVFAAITRMDVTAKGHLVVKDRRRFKLYIFDQEGKLLKAFGKRGEGPGEIKNMNGNGFYLADGLIIVPDRGRIHFFGEDGKFQKTVAISGQIVPRAFVDKNTLISAPSASFNRNIQKEKILIYTIDTEKRQVLAEYNPFKEATQSQESGGNRVVIAIVVGGLTPMMEIYFHKGILYYGMNDRYEIHKVDLQGNAKGSFSVEGRAPAPVSMEYKKGIFNRPGSNAPPAMIDRIVKGLPKVATFFNRIQVDNSGLIYLGIPDPEKRYKQRIDIFSPEGKYLYTTTIELDKDRTIRNLCFKDSLIFLAVEDEEGDIRITKYRVSLPRL